MSIPIPFKGVDNPFRPLFFLLATFLFGGYGPLLAGPPGSDATTSALIEEQIAKFKEASSKAGELIAEGDDLRREKDIEGATSRYRQAFALLPDAPLTSGLRAQAGVRWADHAVIHAESLAYGGRLDEARRTLEAVLAEESLSHHPGSKKLLRRLDDPEWFNPSLTLEHIEKVENVKNDLISGRGFRDLGEYDLAEREYENALRKDLYNSTARRGLEEVANDKNEYYQSARDQTRAAMLREVAKGWESEVPRQLQTSGFVDGGASLSSFRDSQLLDLPVSVAFSEATLLEVVEFLRAKTAELNPQMPGNGLAINLQMSSEDPALSMPITMRLSSIPVRSVIDLVCDATKTRWREEEFSIIIESERSLDTGLVTRTYRVAPNFIGSVSEGGDSAQNAFPFGDSNNQSDGLTLRRRNPQEYLASIGVTFPPGASAFLSGDTLTVRNLEKNQRLINDLVIQNQRAGSKNVVIEVKLIDIDQTVMNELNFDILLGGFNVGGERVFAGGGTTGNQSSGLVSQTSGRDYPMFAPGSDLPIGNFPLTSGIRSGDFALPPDSIDELISSNVGAGGPRLKTPGVLAVGGVFTDPQFQAIFRAVSQKKGVDVISSPSVLTTPGQRAVVKAIREFPYPEEYEPPEIPQNAVVGNDGAAGGFPSVPANPSSFTVREEGVILEGEPVISPDGYSVGLNLSIDLTRFEGFINYGSPIGSGEVEVVANNILQPVFSTIRQKVSIEVGDGQTIAIGGLLNDYSTFVKDKVPFFGDIPILGRLFKGNSNLVKQRAVVLYVSARVIGPDGLPVNQ